MGNLKIYRGVGVSSTFFAVMRCSYHFFAVLRYSELPNAPSKIYLKTIRSCDLLFAKVFSRDQFEYREDLGTVLRQCFTLSIR